MLVDIALKLRRSRHTNPIFGDRITVVADASRAIEYTALAYPAGYVTFLSEDAEDQQPGVNENRQRITQRWGVIVGLDATTDIRGQGAAQSIEAIRPAIFRAIYNWSPSKDYGLLWYGGCKLLEISRATTFWLMTFGAYYWVCGEEGETEEQFERLPDFLGLNVKVDRLQPHDRGLPPSQEYDPRFGPAPWASGPEGRVETEMRIDVPWQTRERIVSMSNQRRES
jgi:hypothetical protein